MPLKDQTDAMGPDRPKHPSNTLIVTSAGKPFVGELQVRDVVYKTIVVHMPVHVPGGMCAPPVRIDVPCMIVLRADLGTVDPNTRRKSNRCRARCTVVYLHGNGTDIGGVAEEAKALSRDLECHVVVPVRLF